MSFDTDLIWNCCYVPVRFTKSSCSFTSIWTACFFGSRCQLWSWIHDSWIMTHEFMIDDPYQSSDSVRVQSIAHISRTGEYFSKFSDKCLSSQKKRPAKTCAQRASSQPASLVWLAKLRIIHFGGESYIGGICATQGKYRCGLAKPFVRI